MFQQNCSNEYGKRRIQKIVKYLRWKVVDG